MANFKTIKELMDHNEQLDKIGFCIGMLTCYECEDWYECKYAFNPDNADMECLRNEKNETSSS